MIILSYCSPLSVSRLSLQVKIFHIQFCQLYLESHPNYGVKTILAKAVPEGFENSFGKTSLDYSLQKVFLMYM